MKISIEQKKEAAIAILNIVAVKSTIDLSFNDEPDEETDIYVSKIDGSYICHVGSEDHSYLLAVHGITEQVQSHTGEKDSTSTIGFSPSKQKWIAWTNRGVGFFGIGTSVKIGFPGYVPTDKLDFCSKSLAFWKDTAMHKSTTAKTFEKDGVEGCLVEWIYSDIVPNTVLRGKKDSFFCAFPKTFGRGEWTAETLEDARQMAIDFAEDLS